MVVEKCFSPPELEINDLVDVTLGNDDVILLDMTPHDDDNDVTPLEDEVILTRFLSNGCTCDLSCDVVTDRLSCCGWDFGAHRLVVVLVLGESAAILVLSDTKAEPGLFSFNGRRLHTMGTGFTGGGAVVAHELTAVTRGNGVASIGGMARVGVVTPEATTGADGKKVSVETSLDVGTSSILLAKLDPFLFFFSR